MNSIITAIRQFFDLFRLWVIISPWDQGLRVRLGRWVALLDAGVHLRIPVIDAFYVQSVRQRVSCIGRQTVTTSDGKTITYGGAVGYAITSIEQLYRTLYHAEDTILNIARARLAQHFSTHGAAQCHPSDLERELSEELSFELAKYGLADVRVYVTEFSVVRTYRLIGDSGCYSNGSILNTDNPYSRIAANGPPC